MFGGAPTFGASFGASQAPSPETAATKKPRQEDKQICLPVTIHGISMAVANRMDDGGDLKFYGVEPSVLLLVAAVESVTRQATSLEMTLNDATGKLKARWFVSDPLPGELDKIVPGTYVSAFGNVRTAPAVHLAINGLRPVESADEVSYHMIEAAHAMLSIQNPGKREPVTPAVNEVKKAVVAETSSATQGGTAPKAMDFQTPEKREASANPYAQAQPPTANPYTQQGPTFVPPAVTTAAQPQKAAGPLKGAELRAAVLSFLKEMNPGPEGVAVETINAKLAPAAADEIRECLTSLIDDAEICITLDDNHFAVV